ncbi:NAD(P)-dependent oxidoreductase [Pseudanabaena sp. 'Roaring Creek']|uniref:NAD(P)-dependent oxidoreductase n=1 Tax=Pseudanabaena sp. 'Roaring Creek' TaxID=1681830 RepID=UPI0006D8397E|nr:NAD(P)-dependent oxidoreductase [Pseudanabaena sp. 'Roaring Creek']
MNRIAILGIGAMGSRMVKKLLEAKYEVVVYSRSADKAKPLIELGATYAPTPREASERANVIISMVTDDEASREIWLNQDTGALLGLKPDAIAIESSTLTVAWTLELAKEIERCGAAFLDAPVVGSRIQVETGKLIYLVGGKAEYLSRVRDILLSISSTVHHVGGIGQGMTVKLAVNALLGIQVAALAEVIGMLTKNGMTGQEAMFCLSELPVISPAARTAGGLMVENNHAVNFALELMEKDLRYFTETAMAVNAVTPIANTMHDLYQEAISRGYGKDNFTGILRMFI